MSQMNSDILAVYRCGNQFRNEKMAEYGLKGIHIGYLTRICAQPGISQEGLAQKMYINKSTVTRQAAVLEETGFITRRPSEEDKRMLMLYPTEKALTLLPKLRQIVEQWDALITQDMTEEEIATVTEVLSRMRERAAGWMEGR